MPLFSVIIPTRDHAGLLPLAFASLRAQSVQDFEALIIGDGMDAATRAAGQAIAAADPRVRLFDLEKKPGTTVSNRAFGVNEAKGRYVAYLDDDDLWFPDHLATHAKLLEHADLAHSRLLAVTPHLMLRSYQADLADDAVRQRLLTQSWNFFNPTVASHRLSAYHALPEGWAEPPPGSWNDQNMWRKFLRTPGLKLVSGREITALHLPSSWRRDMTLADRESELRFWSAALSKPAIRSRLHAQFDDRRPFGGLVTDMCWWTNAYRVLGVREVVAWLIGSPRRRFGVLAGAMGKRFTRVGRDLAHRPSPASS